MALAAIGPCHAVAKEASALLLRAAAGGASLVFRQLFDAATGSVSSLLAEVSSGWGLLIDPVFEQHSRDLALIQELGIQLLACLDTHGHADHVTGSWLLRQATDCAIGLAAVAGAENVTLPLRHGDRIRFGGRLLEVRATPGHTDGCLSDVLDDHSLALTGDALLVGAAAAAISSRVTPPPSTARSASRCSACPRPAGLIPATTTTAAR